MTQERQYTYEDVDRAVGECWGRDVPPRPEDYTPYDLWQAQLNETLSYGFDHPLADTDRAILEAHGRDQSRLNPDKVDFGGSAISEAAYDRHRTRS